MKKNILSLVAIVLFAFFGLSACMMDPTDRQEVISTNSSVHFYGGTLASNDSVDIQVLNPTNDQWETKVTTQSSKYPLTITFKGNPLGLYFWDVWYVIPQTYWEPGIGFGYKAQVSAQSGLVPLMTFASSSPMYCYQNSSNLLDFIDKCKGPNSPVARLYTSDYVGVDRGCTADGEKLVSLLNDYRAAKDLPPIPLSPSLCAVAQAHVMDLYLNHPETSQCNMHSWSTKGPWTSCCYTPDHAQEQCMWDKPGELTDYKHYAYEVAAGTSDPSAALNSWKTSPPHNDVILEQDIWKGDNWQAVGAAVYKGYAVAWFGKEPDTVSP
jgi:uncharacterized protein YkwD